MSFVLGNVGRVLVNGVSVSATLSGWAVSHQRATSEVTTLPESGAKFVPGLMSGSVTVRGPQDSTGQSLHAQIAAAIGVDNAFLATICPDGTALGSFAMTVLGDVSEYAIDASVSDAVGFTMTAAADESVDMGFLVHGLTAETVDGNGTAVDRGVGVTTTGGGVGVLSVTAFTGLTSIGVKIQHSTDNVSWFDLITFTSVTATATAERKFLAAGTTVNRYVRAVTDVTGTGSATFLVALSPR